ncbi:unnamed protein product [Cylicocyclus nassatus]|uniref:Uncharacterized protein n=1 Tax=Cylicocyclus nassatus TaxID=53992 RepID=A0AA36DMR6_CYLNA|nr:unnamed protein product [Cylicocyclus nassatus]
MVHFDVYNVIDVHLPSYPVCILGLSTDFIAWYLQVSAAVPLIPAAITKTTLRIGYSLNHIGRYKSQLSNGRIEDSLYSHSTNKALRYGKRSQVPSGFGTTFAEHHHYWSSAYGNNTCYGYSSFLDVRCCPRSEVNGKRNDRNNICGYDYYKSSYTTLI